MIEEGRARAGAGVFFGRINRGFVSQLVSRLPFFIILVNPLKRTAIPMPACSPLCLSFGIPFESPFWQSILFDRGLRHWRSKGRGWKERRSNHGALSFSSICGSMNKRLRPTATWKECKIGEGTTQRRHANLSICHVKGLHRLPVHRAADGLPLQLDLASETL